VEDVGWEVLENHLESYPQVVLADLLHHQQERYGQYCTLACLWSKYNFSKTLSLQEFVTFSAIDMAL
jgi:hypothetical protein